MLVLAGLCVLSLPSILVRGVDALDRLERHRYGTGLPSSADIADLAGRCQVTAVFGPEVALCPQAQPSDAFSPYLQAAVQSAEDRRFFWHDGVDRFAVLRGMASYVGPGSQSGGSTITQQVARTLFLQTRPAGARGSGLPAIDGLRHDLDALDRKRREWIIARRLEQVWDKRRILAAYLNVAPHADGLFGFEAASRHLFGKHARDLTLDESAMLVAMLPAPNLRHPVRHPDALLAATRGVLADMVRDGHVTPTEADAALDRGRRRLASRRASGDPTLRASARRPFEHRRVRDLAREQAASRGVDLDVTTRLFMTLDPRFQAMADDIARRSPAGYQASAVFVGREGGVLAVSGPDYAAAQYNAAFEARRSIGSVGKVMLHAAALDAPALAGRTWSTAKLAGYSPREDSRHCRGRMALVDALAQSCNRPFVRLAQELGPRAGAMVKAFGFTVPDNPLLIATGGVHGNALTTTRLFSAFANGGWLRDPSAFAGAVGADGRIIGPKPARPARRVLSDRVARQMMIDLRQPVMAEHGTARAAAGRSRAAHVSGKTGTSNDGRDAWFVGATAEFAGTVVAQATGRGGSMTGGRFPAESFGGVVDGYWMRRNWLAGDAGRAAAAQPVPGLEFNLDRARALEPEALRLSGMVLGTMLLLALLRRRRPEPPRPALPGDTPPSAQGVPVSMALRPVGPAGA